MLKKNNEEWSQIKDLYTKLYSIPPRVIDYVACNPVLHMSCSGLANSTIVSWTGFEMEYVQEILKEFLNFTGHTMDLTINPLLFYEESEEDYNTFIEKLSGLDLNTARMYYNICKKYGRIRKEIKKYYDES